MVKVLYETQAATATAGMDFEAREGTVKFREGQKQKSIRVPVVDDSLDEPNETLQIELSEPSRATLSDAIAIGTILDDDPLISPILAGFRLR